MAFPDELIVTLVKSGLEVSNQFLGHQSLLTTVYRDSSFEELGEKGKIVSIPFPGVMTVTNDASTVGTFQTLTTTSKQVTLSEMPAVNFTFSDWNQFITNPTRLKEMVTAPALTAIYQYLNSGLATLITAANFDSYTPIAHEVDNVFTRAQIQKGNANLTGAKVPTTDSTSMSFVMPAFTYPLTLNRDEFSSATIRGDGETLKTGVISPVLGLKILPDHGLGHVTVSSVAKWVGFLHHKFAIGLAVRPLPIPDAPGVEGTTINFNGIPVRFLFSYDHTSKSYKGSFDLSFGYAILRKECGQIIYANKV